MNDGQLPGTWWGGAVNCRVPGGEVPHSSHSLLPVQSCGGCCVCSPGLWWVLCMITRPVTAVYAHQDCGACSASLRLLLLLLLLYLSRCPQTRGHRSFSCHCCCYCRCCYLCTQAISLLCTQACVLLLPLLPQSHVRRPGTVARSAGPPTGTLWRWHVPQIQVQI